MQNPDPKRYKLKKLYGKGYILVDKQILSWRKKRKKGIIPEISLDAPESPTVEKQPDELPTPLPDFKFFE